MEKPPMDRRSGSGVIGPRGGRGRKGQGGRPAPAVLHRRRGEPHDLFVALCRCDADADAVYEAILAELADPSRERSYAEDRKLLIGALIHVEGKQAMLELIHKGCARLAC